jgi:hypothetical protein
MMVKRGRSKLYIEFGRGRGAATRRSRAGEERERERGEERGGRVASEEERERGEHVVDSGRGEERGQVTQQNRDTEQSTADWTVTPFSFLISIFFAFSTNLPSILFYSCPPPFGQIFGKIPRHVVCVFNFSA